jgi:K+ transporter
MQRHPVDPVSAVLGLLAVALGVLVAAGALDDTHGGWWLVIAAVVIGVALLPWTWRRQEAVEVAAAPDAAEEAEPPADVTG